MRSTFLRYSMATLLLALLGACGSDEANLDEHMSAGQAYLENEAFAEAILEFKNALQIDPNHGGAHWGLAQAYQESRRLREAFWELRETARLDPANHEARLRFGSLSVLAGDPEEALRQADGVLSDDPEAIAAYVLRGRALTALGRPEESLEAWEQALAVNPESVLPRHHIARYHRQRGDRETAEAVFRELTEIAPDALSYGALASFLADDRSRDAEAEGAYRKALELAEEEERTLAVSMLASFYFTRDRVDEAIELVEGAIETAEDPLDLIYLQAGFHRARGDEAQAEELIREATRRRPDDVRPHLRLAAYRASQGDWDGALAAAAQGVKVDPTNSEARVKQAESLIEVGLRDDVPDRVVEGRSIADAVLAEEPTNPEALFVKAKIDFHEGRTDAAVNQLRAAIDARPNWAASHFLLGAALASQGQDTLARAELARALEIDPRLLEARKVLTRVHLRLRESEYGVEEGNRYLREKPDDIDVRILVAQGLAFQGQLDPALEVLEVIPEADRDAAVYVALGKLHMRKNQHDLARSFLLRAYEERPGDPGILRPLMQLDLIGGRAEETRARLEAAVKANPEDSQLRVIQGIFHLRQNRGDEAEPAFRRAIALDPANFQAYNHLASYYGRVGRLNEMIGTYERALESVPDDARLHYFLGLLYEAEGRREKAMERYEAAIRHDPNLAEAKNNLAFLLAESNAELDRALDLAQEAKALMPESPYAADTLGWVLYRRGIPSAAISYLKEAELGFDPTSRGIGEVRFHLALVYEAAGELQNARASAMRALDGIFVRKRSLRAQGAPEEAEPAWAAEARAMLDRIPEAPPA